MSEQYVYPQPQPQRGMPVWAWILIGCGAVSLLFFLFFAVIMGAILFPVFRQAREKARAVSCMSNLKQIGTAMMMYTQDYDGQFPRAGNWMGATLPYTKTLALYHCPSVASNAGAFNYAFNSKLSGQKLKKIGSPATTAAVYDSTTSMMNATDPLTSLPSPGRHNGGNYIGYADGHVKWQRLVGYAPPVRGPRSGGR